MTKNEAQGVQLAAALRTLKRARELSRDKTGEDLIVLRDSCVQRFEYCFDLAWKLLKEMLEERHAISCTSPKTCLVSAFEQHLIDESELWAQMAKWRNLTSHIYYEKAADDVFANLDAVIAAMERLSNTTSEAR